MTRTTLRRVDNFGAASQKHCVGGGGLSPAERQACGRRKPAATSTKSVRRDAGTTAIVSGATCVAPLHIIMTGHGRGGGRGFGAPAGATAGRAPGSGFGAPPGGVVGCGCGSGSRGGCTSNAPMSHCPGGGRGKPRSSTWETGLAAQMAALPLSIGQSDWRGCRWSAGRGSSGACRRGARSCRRCRRGGRGRWRCCRRCRRVAIQVWPALVATKLLPASVRVPPS